MLVPVHGNEGLSNFIAKNKALIVLTLESLLPTLAICRLGKLFFSPHCYDLRQG